MSELTTLLQLASTLKLPAGFYAWVDHVQDNVTIRGPDNAIVGRISRYQLEDDLGQQEANKIVARELSK